MEKGESSSLKSHTDLSDLSQDELEEILKRLPTLTPYTLADVSPSWRIAIGCVLARKPREYLLKLQNARFYEHILAPEDGETSSEAKTNEKYDALTRKMMKLMIYDKMSIRVQILSGHIVCLEMRSSDTIVTVKTKIQNKYGLCMDQQVLAFSGKLLEDTRTLAFYHVKKNSLLYLKEIQ